MLYIKLFIEREKNIGQSAPECPFKGVYPFWANLYQKLQISAIFVV